MKTDSLHFKIANDIEEFNQIHRMNYETFVNKIPQHERNPERMLVDRFHNENTYIIAKKGSELIGMIAVRGNRPFSLDQKLPNIHTYLPEGGSPCEIRLLSVHKDYRSSIVFYKLVERAVSHCLRNGYNLALISGTVRQLKLYKRIGFETFGPLTGENEARFQPMFITKENFEGATKAFSRLMHREDSQRKVMNFLPGPVPVKKEVEIAFSKEAVSHRSTDFMNQISDVKSRLKEMTGAPNVQVLVGTGTLSNDLVAAQLHRQGGRGLILANGEFGLRLVDHARRMDLHYDVIAKGWIEEITLEEVDEFLHYEPDIRWLWLVHCETSTGYLFDLEGFKRLCNKHGVNLCVDACSSAGSTPLNLNGVFMATTVSGKAFGSYPGLAVVFHREEVEADNSLPRYLDLGMYQENNSVPYTHSSNLVAAFHTALLEMDPYSKARLNYEVRRTLERSGISCLGDGTYSPGIITIPLPEDISSRGFGDNLKKKKILISYESDYLLKRNWVQIALMGEYKLNEVMMALDKFKEDYKEQTASEAAVL
ncbi:aminotransferase class V-fold PLP-dependent enzyme [Rossellomorea vietnamensis]|uniref:Aminotransferase class V-fold PLP-dependent enzyme n=1 Tax=Rossellomorea vietnamensis TaxID=218284 RepID=A0A5D4KJ60_9BACI|nr:aminotransferase class V-fold PLP-dependent enzyme [Rossellomorea vietnamensis]TYR77324.1 aminotransferase class V-fold PLP-dependent enzyme [Rossellomorea vietnamensis]